MDDDKEKLVIDELVDTVKGAVGDAAKAEMSGRPLLDPKRAEIVAVVFQDRTLARRPHAPQPAAPINVDPNEDDR
jgi:hypothetical protein